ncbi:hypothetical protein PSAC2689_150137 [Paraburkholderia sacchari]
MAAKRRAYEIDPLAPCQKPVSRQVIGLKRIQKGGNSSVIF